MITRIEAYNYRCFRRLDVGLGGFKVLAGNNGAGKTTLLDIPVLLRDFVRHKEIGPVFFENRENALAPRAQQPQEVVTYGLPPRTAASVVIEATLPTAVIDRLITSLPQYRDRPWRIPNTARYELSLEPFNDRLEIAEEFVTVFVDPENSPEHALSEQPTGLRRPRTWRPPHGEGLIGGRGGSFKAPTYLLLDRQRRGAQSLRADAMSRGLSVRRVDDSLAALSATRINEFDRRAHFELDLADDRLALAEVPADHTRYPILAWLQSFLRDSVLGFDPQANALRFASPPAGTQSRQGLRADAANLPWLLMRLAEGGSGDRFKDWISQLRHTIPGLQTVRPYVRKEDRHASFQVIYDDGRDINASALSEGTLRIIALTAVAYIDGVPPLLIIEQPEDGVHPKGISELVEAFRTQTLATDHRRDQVWVSTHSPILLSEVSLADIVVLTSDGDGTQALRGSEHPRLADWKGSVNPGKLFASGILG